MKLLSGFMVNWQERARLLSAVAADVMKERTYEHIGRGFTGHGWIVQASSCVFLLLGLLVGELAHQIPVAR